METEKEDDRELPGRSYFAIVVVLGFAASLGLALLVFILVTTASSVRDAVSPPERVPVAAAAVDTGSGGDAAGSGVTDSATTGDAAIAVTDTADLIAAGQGLTAVCAACHSTSGTKGVGPTWMGLFGSERNFDDGTSVTADDAYIRESIVDPGARVVDGFTNGIMPGNFGETFSAEELDAIVAYVASL